MQGRRASIRPSVTRTEIADEAGPSEHQRKTAMRLVAIRDEVVETGDPPTNAVA